MNSHTFSIVAFIAAVLLGYGFISQRNADDSTELTVAPMLMGYYMKDAVVVETNLDGTPRLQFTAASVTQNPRDNAVSLETVQVDYLAAQRNSDAAPTHWVLNAAQGYRATNSDIVSLNGSVVARTIATDSESSARAATFITEALDIDIEQQHARSDAPVDITLGNHKIAGAGLFVDLPRERLRLDRSGQLRLAAKPTATEAPSPSAPAISLPTIFEFDSLDFRDNVVRLINVRSKVEPFVQANEAVATDTDLTNNRFTLTGDVRFELPQRGTLQAHSTVVTVRDSRIVHALATGQPVSFEHQRQAKNLPNDKPADIARGRARSIDYDVPANTLAFKGDVWFSTGRFEWRGEEFQYNLIDGSGKTLSRSTTTIQPRERTPSVPQP
ncbi:MAG: LPS export ABC transporter periplasmic protein LptC [Candidatus Obscuribacterales bacterium]|nr:LPS export ABC transporter periplasmic protein LptC [Steroidobacteraceae bacterium]